MQEPEASEVHTIFPVDAKDVGLGNPAGNVAFAAVAILGERQLGPGIISRDGRLDIRNPRQELRIPLLHPAILNKRGIPEGPWSLDPLLIAPDVCRVVGLVRDRFTGIAAGVVAIAVEVEDIEQAHSRRCRSLVHLVEIVVEKPAVGGCCGLDRCPVGSVLEGEIAIAAVGRRTEDFGGRVHSLHRLGERGRFRNNLGTRRQGRMKQGMS